jgi:hypothetical protein
MLDSHGGGQNRRRRRRGTEGAEGFRRRRRLGGVREQVHHELVSHALGRPGWGEVSGDPGAISQA